MLSTLSSQNSILACIMKKILILIGLFVYSVSSAQHSSVEIFEGLQKLKMVGSVLYIAAHPDDENTRLLTYFSKEKKIRTAYLSVTRGDGGQNLIGNEQGELLGLIRTHELLAARTVDGAAQYFTRANDFGYSKNPEETFRIWNKDSVLSDVVWVIRQFKPDIIICRFPTTGEGGHGHHTASAMLAEEAFDAAADPAKFSWQLKYTEVWKTKRLFWNTFNFGGNNTTSPDQIQIDVGGYDPLTGESIGEIASESRSMHKSQGFGTAKQRGKSIEFFKQLKGDKVSESLFEGIDLSWSRLKKDRLEEKINNCIKSYEFTSPSKSVPQLIEIYQLLYNIPDINNETSFYMRKKLEEVKNLIVNAAGIWMESVSERNYAVPGDTVGISNYVLTRSDIPVKLISVSAGRTNSTLNTLLRKDESDTIRLKMKIPADHKYSNPYWLNMPAAEGYFVLDDITKTGMDVNPPPVMVRYNFSINGVDISIENPVVFKIIDPERGEIYKSLEILPPAVINFSAKAYLFRNNKPEKIQMLLKFYADTGSAQVNIRLPEKWTASPSEFNVTKTGNESEYILESLVTPDSTVLSGNISATINFNGTMIDQSIFRVEYAHISSRFMLRRAVAAVTNADLKETIKNIGYIPGAGDEVDEFLRQIGFNLTILDKEKLSVTNLKEFDAIVTGIRAFNTNEWLKEYDQKLLNFVRDGGNLIIQYNTNNRLGPLASKIFPYPFTISRERVTDENAEVAFLKPDHPVLNYPNKITLTDFKGWRQERGIYFATEIDSSYEKIFSMHDPGEKDATGSLIIAKYGKGSFAYTGLSFFRQLPYAHPGASRLFVNLLSLPK